MKKGLWFLVLVFVVTPVFAQDASEIVRRASWGALPGKWDFSAVMTTRGKDRPTNAQRLSIQLRRPSAGGYQVLFEPRGSDESGAMQMTVSKSRVVKFYDLGDHQRILDARAPFMQSAFSLEDVALKFLSWGNQELLGEARLKDRPCWKIASYPPSAGESAYARVESWIDKQYGALLRAIAYDEQGEIVKEFNVRSFQQLEETWMIKTLDLSVPSEQARSRFEILDGKKRGS
jgi:hypothetical protein